MMARRAFTSSNRTVLDSPPDVLCWPLAWPRGSGQAARDDRYRASRHGNRANSAPEPTTFCCASHRSRYTAWNYAANGGFFVNGDAIPELHQQEIPDRLPIDPGALHGHMGHL